MKLKIWPSLLVVAAGCFIGGLLPDTAARLGMWSPMLILHAVVALGTIALGAELMAQGWPSVLSREWTYGTLFGILAACLALSVLTSIDQAEGVRMAFMTIWMIATLFGGLAFAARNRFAPIQPA